MSPISAPAGPAALAFENFLAVLTIIFLQQHLRLQLPRNRTERFGALRAADAITIRKFHERYSNPGKVVCLRGTEGANPAPSSGGSGVGTGYDNFIWGHCGGWHLGGCRSFYSERQ